MGRTEFSGPVYGAVGVLAVAHIDSVAADSTDLEVFQIDVPATEDWFITRVAAYCGNQGNGGTVDVEDDGASVLTANITLATADSVESTPTTTSPEDEGRKVAAGSTLTVDATDGATTAISDLTVTVEGYKRKIGAPR